MKLKKRIVALFLAFTLMVLAVPNTVFAFDEETNDIKASSYLDMYTAALISKGITGKLTLAYQVFATHDMQKVGVWGIYVRNSNGTIQQFIRGTVANGLLTTNTWYHDGSYTLNLTSGNTYYCTVIVVAEDANGGDTRSITTQQVVCP